MARNSNRVFNLNDIELNVAKTKVMIMRKGKYTEERLKLGGEHIHSVIPEERVRILGAFINSKGTKKHQKDKIKALVNGGAQLILRKIITEDMGRYIINQVIAPAVEYLLMDTTMDANLIEYINRKLRRAMKGK